MNRPVDFAKRAELLERIVDHALATGVTSLALRPTAAAVGTSARMLVHHFGGREALAAEVLLAIETRLVASMGDLPAMHPAAALRRMWSATTAPSMARLVKASFEIWGRALVNPAGYEGFLTRAFAPWRDALAAGLQARGVAKESSLTAATLAIAGFIGLQLARLTTGDAAGADAAFKLLVTKVLEIGDKT